jgi:hypothetical protein
MSADLRGLDPADVKSMIGSFLALFGQVTSQTELRLFCG